MFSWMLVEGWHLYLALIKVFSAQKKSFLERYYILGYGKTVLFIIVVVVVVVMVNEGCI